jgi:TonB family protein
MRLLSARVLVVLTIGALVGAPSQSADIARQLKGLEEFLKWAHPEGDGCASPADVSIVQTWDGGLRARYRIVCGASTRVLQGIFQVREKEGVWQIASGFEADAPRIDEALGPPPDTSAPAGAARGGISPPPRNADGGAPETPLDAVAPPAIRSEPSPEYPEEAGRARLIGEAHIELLVELAPDGAPLRARPLRGPDPDLGMRRAAMEAVMRWRFNPARLAGKPLTFFRSVDVTFSGLPPESRDWVHRALFRVEAIVSEDELVVDEALRRVRAGEAFEKVAAESVGSSRGGDWGLVSAATLPAAVRRALHEAPVGGLAGPVAAEGLHYLILKRGEVYYALKPRPGGDLTYQVLHQKNAPEGDALKQAVERDIADYLAESRRQIYVNEAARLMGIRQSSAQVGRLEIRTDVLPEDEIKTLGQVVESVVRTQQAFWSPLVTLRPFNQQILVYAWAREADHDRLHRMWQAGSAGPVPEPPAEPGRAASKTKLWSFIGEYLPASHILSVPCERMGGHLNVPILIHEAIHMLDYERVYAAGARPSQWFEEGLATYFGFSQIGARLDIEPGDIRRSGTIVSGNVRLQFDPRTPLQEYLRKIRDDGPMPLRALLESGAGDPTWTGERTIRAYCASWTLVHFLLHGAKGARRAEFEEYARAEARGAGGYDTFVRLFGPDLASLEAAWHRYEENL